MTTLELGAAPQGLIVRLAEGGAFQQAVRLEDAAGVAQPWPAGTEMRLVLEVSPTERMSYPFELAGADAIVKIPEADVAALPQWPAPAAQIWLVYEGQPEFLWCSGEVVFYG